MQAAYAPNREQLIKRRIRDSELTRVRIGEPERVAYGPADIERLDIYRTERDAAPVFIFIHGGAWRSGRSKDFATPAEMFLAAGAHYVVPDFAWVQDVGGSLMVVADQVRRAIAWVYRNAVPLPTLRRRPRGRLRTDRGRRGLLLLHRSGLTPHTPCQSPGALTRVAACTLAQSPNL
jgi:hypothetical protein